MSNKKQNILKNEAEAISEAIETNVSASSSEMPSLEQLDADGYLTKAAKIRRLYDLGYREGPISRHLGISYQHAYNTLAKVKKEAASEPA